MDMILETEKQQLLYDFSGIVAGVSKKTNFPFKKSIFLKFHRLEGPLASSWGFPVWGCAGCLSVWGKRNLAPGGKGEFQRH